MTGLVRKTNKKRTAARTTGPTASAAKKSIDMRNDKRKASEPLVGDPAAEQVDGFAAGVFKPKESNPKSSLTTSSPAGKGKGKGKMQAGTAEAASRKKPKVSKDSASGSEEHEATDGLDELEVAAAERKPRSSAAGKRKMRAVNVSAADPEDDSLLEFQNCGTEAAAAKPPAASTTAASKTKGKHGPSAELEATDELKSAAKQGDKHKAPTSAAGKRKEQPRSSSSETDSDFMDEPPRPQRRVFSSNKKSKVAKVTKKMGERKAGNGPADPMIGSGGHAVAAFGESDFQASTRPFTMPAATATVAPPAVPAVVAVPVGVAPEERTEPKPRLSLSCGRNRKTTGSGAAAARGNNPIGVTLFRAAATAPASAPTTAPASAPDAAVMHDSASQHRRAVDGTLEHLRGSPQSAVRDGAVDVQRVSTVGAMETNDI